MKFREPAEGNRRRWAAHYMSLRIARPLILNHVLSPYGISILSTIVFLIAWAFPAGLYTSIVQEPDLMFLDAETLLFFLLCVAGFWLGLLLFDFLIATPELLRSRVQSSRLAALPLLLPLMITTGMTLLAASTLIKQAPDLFILLLTAQGGDVKDALADSQLGVVGWGANIQTPVLWWTYWNLLRRAPASKSRTASFFCWLIFAVAFLAQLGLALVRVSRSDLMPVFGGLAVIYFLYKIHRGEIRTRRILGYLVVAPVAVLAVFGTFGLVRGDTDPSVAFGTFVGYTLASYNRLAAVVQGTMHYPYGGHGAYLSYAITHNNALNKVLPLRDIFGWPSYLEIWNSEFQAPQSASLNSFLIWSGAFGYLFSDFGWGTPLILVGYGLVYALAWREIKRGTSIGLTMYPWLAFCALSWFASNMAFDTRFTFFLLTGFLLTGYERLLSKSFEPLSSTNVDQDQTA